MCTVKSIFCICLVVLLKREERKIPKLIRALFSLNRTEFHLANNEVHINTQDLRSKAISIMYTIYVSVGKVHRCSAYYLCDKEVSIFQLQ